MLMDGKQSQVSKKYISTQSDWSTDKNVKFIFDFWHDTQRSEFNYFIQNKSSFIKVVCEDQVDKTLSVLSSEPLYNSFSRPNLSEAIKLYGYTDPQQTE